MSASFSSTQLILVSALSLGIGFAASPVAAQDGSPRIVKPGAPGKSSEVITAEHSIKLGQSYFTEHDVSFMQDMIVHHDQAIEMSALIKGRSASQQMALLGRRITTSQTSEIEMMRTWLRRRGAPAESPMGYGHHAGHADQPMMQGMLSPKQMDALAAATGDFFDKLYLSGMILHHQGAISMVNSLMQNERSGEDPELSGFIASIRADQSAEILKMSGMLERYQSSNVD